MDLFLIDDAVRRSREVTGKKCEHYLPDGSKCGKEAAFAVHTLQDSHREHRPEGHDDYYCEEHSPRCSVGRCPEVGVIFASVSTDGSFSNLHGDFCPAHFKEYFEVQPNFGFGPGWGCWGGPGDEENRYCRLLKTPPEEGFRGDWVPGYTSKKKQLGS